MLKKEQMQLLRKEGMHLPPLFPAREKRLPYSFKAPIRMFTVCGKVLFVRVIHLYMARKVLV